MIKNILKTIKKILFTPLILKDYFLFKSKQGGPFRLNLKDLYPCPFDKTFNTSFDRHYIYHTSWAARTLKKINPAEHVDIGSSLFFSAIVSAFVPIKFYDYRPAALDLSNFFSGQADLTKLTFADNSLNSFSCMHVVEHIGLGRYGDPIDPNGDIKAMGELKRVMAPGGSLLFVVPVGKPKIMFNAHRIYSYEQVVEQFKGFTLHEFALIPEKTGSLIYSASPDRVAQENYGCGCFWFKKNSI